MASSLEALGLAGPDDATIDPLLRLIEPHVHEVGRTGDVHLLRYDDPTGARLNLAWSDADGLLDMIPSFAAAPGAELAEVTSVGGEVVMADVHADGDLATRLACDLVQWRHLPARPVSGPAAITALCREATVHPDAASYAASLGSGLPWAAESFLSFGLFGDDPVDGHARMSGTVLDSRTHVVELTGHTFHAARVRTAGFEADVVMAASEHPDAPAVGAILSGTVYLVADMATLESSRRRRWLRRR